MMSSIAQILPKLRNVAPILQRYLQQKIYALILKTIYMKIYFKIYIIEAEYYT